MKGSHLGDPRPSISAGKARHLRMCLTAGTTARLSPPLLPGLWAGDPMPAMEQPFLASVPGWKWVSAVPSTIYDGPSGRKEAALPGKTGREGGGRGLLWAGGGGCRTLCIKRSESTIFHCWQSQPRHQLLGESSLKSLLILFLPLHFFPLFLAGVLDKASLPPLQPLPQLPQEAWEPEEGLQPGRGVWRWKSCMHVRL